MKRAVTLHVFVLCGTICNVSVYSFVIWSNQSYKRCNLCSAMSREMHLFRPWEKLIFFLLFLMNRAMTLYVFFECVDFCWLWLQFIYSYFIQIFAKMKYYLLLNKLSKNCQSFPNLSGTPTYWSALQVMEVNL